MIESASSSNSGPNYDAALIHGYWLSRSQHPDNVDGFRGSLRTRLTTRAGVDLHRNEGPMKLVYVGGRLKGPSYPSTADLFAAEASQKYQISEEDIITLDTGFGTEAETLGFEQLAEQNGWNRVCVISFEDHDPSVRRFTPRIRTTNASASTSTVEHRSVEEILLDYDDPHVSNLAQRLARSRFHYGFVAYELAKTLIMAIPGGKDRLYRASEKSRTLQDDSIFNDLVTHAIDVFKS